MLVSATMSAEVLEQFEPWVPNPQRVFVSAAPAQQPASSQAPPQSDADGAADADAEGVKVRPRWGWDETQRASPALLNSTTEGLTYEGFRLIWTSGVWRSVGSISTSYTV